MDTKKILLISGVSVAVLAGLYLILKPGSAKAQPSPRPNPNQNQDPFGVDPFGPDIPEEFPQDPDCPPTKVKCSNYAQSKKCYFPLLVNKNGLYPNGTNPCEAPAPSYDYGYDYDQVPDPKRGLGIDDNVYN